MKCYLIILLSLITISCSTKKLQEKSTDGSLQTITILKGEGEKVSIQIPSNASTFNLGSLSQYSLLYGQLGQESSLRFGKQSIMMTTISMQEAVSPQSGFLNISANQEGAWAIVKGYLAGDLYEAEIICILSEEPDQKAWDAFSRGSTNLFDGCQ